MAFPSGRPGSATTPPGDALRWHPGPPRAPDRCGTNLPPQRTPKKQGTGLDMAGFHGGSWDLSGISMGFYLKKSGTQAFWVERRCYNQQNRGKSS